MLCWLDSCRIEFPRNREIRIRLVGAEVARLDASREDAPQGGITLYDPFHHRLDCLGDALPGSFRSRRCPPITSAEPHGAREFRGQSIDFLLRLFGALDVSQLLGFFEFFAQLRKSAPVGSLGCVVEHLARVTQTADMDPRLFEILVPARQAVCGLPGFMIMVLARDSSSQIEHVEFDGGMSQETGEVGEPLSVL